MMKTLKIGTIVRNEIVGEEVSSEHNGLYEFVGFNETFKNKYKIKKIHGMATWWVDENGEWWDDEKLNSNITTIYEKETHPEVYL